VEAVLEDFEKRNANNEDKSVVEAQRRYLGGDSDHSILVKGLDMALLEQNKTRAAGLSIEDDDSLEQAFQDVSSQATGPKKRTREDLIRELKEKRAQKDEAIGGAPAAKTAEEEARLLEDAKKKGKFKPIGFKSVDPPEQTGKKKKKVKVDAKDGERKKRRKVVEDGTNLAAGQEAIQESAPAPLASDSSLRPTASLLVPPVLEPEPLDFDIFAGAGEYEGIDLGDEDDEKEEEEEKSTIKEDNLPEGSEPEFIPRRWIETDEPEPTSDKQEPLPSILKPHSPPPQPEDGEEGEEGEQVMRLAPLASSALPSIKDFLAMDRAAGGHGKGKKRKGAKKEGAKNDNEDAKKRNAEAKANRDYKRSVTAIWSFVSSSHIPSYRLKTYTDKKAES
jgi:IK cytokine